MKNFIIYFIVQFVYVILTTIKSILTIKGTKTVSSIASSVTYGFYTIVLVFTADDIISLPTKICVTMITNLIGTWLGMWISEKMHKDKLWEIVATIQGSSDEIETACEELHNNKIGFNKTQTSFENEYVFHIYSKNQKESALIKNILQSHNAKYIVHEETAKL